MPKSLARAGLGIGFGGTPEERPRYPILAAVAPDRNMVGVLKGPGRAVSYVDRSSARLVL